MYIKHIELWLAYGAWRLLIPYQKKTKRKGKNGQAKKTWGLFKMSRELMDVWGTKSEFIGCILNFQDMLIELVH